MTVGEIRKGIERSIDGPRKQVLLDWLEFELPRFFVDRVLPVNTLVADQWGKLTGRISRPVPAVDSLIAATAHAHNLSLVTRNIRDFEDLGIDVINPFND